MRTNITSEEGKLIGWFDDAAAEQWGEDTRWDGSNHVSIPTGSQWDHERLYRTAGGRWVLYRWSQRQGARDVYEYIGVDAARDWLALNGHDDEIERLFGTPLEPERGPGRPALGDKVEVRIPPAMLDAIDGVRAANAEHDDEWATMPRAEVIRRLLRRALYADAAGTDPAQLWRERHECYPDSSAERDAQWDAKP